MKKSGFKDTDCLYSFPTNAKTSKKYDLIPDRDGSYRFGVPWNGRTGSALFTRLNKHIRKYLKLSFPPPKPSTRRNVKDATSLTTNLLRSTMISISRYQGFCPEVVGSVSGI